MEVNSPNSQGGVNVHGFHPALSSVSVLFARISGEFLPFVVHLPVNVCFGKFGSALSRVTADRLQGLSSTTSAEIIVTTDAIKGSGAEGRDFGGAAAGAGAG